MPTRSAPGRAAEGGNVQSESSGPLIPQAHHREAYGGWKPPSGGGPSLAQRRRSRRRGQIVRRRRAAGRCSGGGRLTLVRRLVLLGPFERDQKVVPVRGGIRGDITVHLAGDDELDQGLGERTHVVELSGGDRVGDLVRPVFANQVLDARV